MKKEQDLVSVIIPVYNVAAYVEKCVRSVMASTYKKLEIVCIDDGSRDGSGELLDDLSSSDPRIRVIHQENRGISGARNRGLAEASGDYIALIDSDDYVHPRYIGSMMDCMRERKASLVICGVMRFEEGKDPLPDLSGPASYRRLDSSAFFANAHARNMTWGRIYRREDIGDLRYSPDTRISDDTLFNLSVVSNMVSPRIYMTDFPMYFYLNRPSSLVHTAKSLYYIDFGKWYLKNAASVEQGSWNWLVCLEAVKLTLAYRYLTSFREDSRERTREADRILRECLGRLRCGPRTWLVHALMALLPPLYRACRVRDDPTLLDFERNQKKMEKNKETFL